MQTPSVREQTSSAIPDTGLTTGVPLFVIIHIEKISKMQWYHSIFINDDITPWKLYTISVVNTTIRQLIISHGWIISYLVFLLRTDQLTR